MKLSEYFDFGKAENKYDVAIRMFNLIYCAVGFIVFFVVGIFYMKTEIWLLTFGCCVLGIAVCIILTRTFINMIRKDRQKEQKFKAGLLKRLLYVFIFCMATVAFLTIGIIESAGDVKYLIITFVGSYGGAVISCAIVRMVISFAGKGK